MASRVAIAVFLLGLAACDDARRVPGPVGRPSVRDATVTSTPADASALPDAFGADRNPTDDAAPVFDDAIAGPADDASSVPGLDASTTPNADASSGLDASAPDAARPCGMSGARCATSANCCSGTVCTGGECRLPPAACGPTGDTCANDNDCCPGLVCPSGACTACKSDRLTCGSDGECCSGYCRAGYCGARPDPATCEPLGDDCNNNVDNCCESATSCRAGDNSLAYSTCCQDSFEPCGGNIDCCGETTCRNGVCQPVPADGSCADHGDCGFGFNCIEGRCDIGQCHTYQESCFSDAADNLGCCPGLTCFYTNGRDQCVLSIGSGLCTNDGDACIDSGECCFPSICNSSNVCEDFLSCSFPGAACTNPSQCCSGTCYGGQCGEITPSCAGDTQLCGGAWGGCCSGLTCSNGRCSSGGTCAANGASCNNPSQCCTGRCTNGACGDGVPGCVDDGDSCSSPSSCCSGRCSGGQCVPNTVSCAASGASCGVSAACCTGLSCNNGQCAVPAGSCEGQDCGTSSCCGSAPYCTSNSGGIFVWRCRAACGPSGQFCQDNADCCGGLICDGQQCGDPTPCSGRGCSTGGDCCDHDAYCLNGACARSCGSRGVACGDDFDCCSTECDNDHCL